MKNYKEFLDSKKQTISEETEVVVSNDPEILNVEDLPNLLGEADNRHDTMDPPNVLIMRRVSVRQYPNKQRVALYYVDKINKYVTVPYTAMQWSASEVTTEETKNTIVDQLSLATESEKSTKLVFEDGSSIYTTHILAKQLLKLHESLNKEHKKEFVEIAGRSKRDFIDIQNFAKQN